MFLGLKHNEIKAGFNFQKLKKKQKKLGFQRIEPMTFCIKTQAATVALISHFKILTYEEL
jgi:hypothetical protein